MYKIIINLTLALIISTPAFSQNIRLNDALASAYENNPTLAQTRAEILDFDEAVIQTMSAMYPNITATLNTTATRNHSYDIKSYANTATASISQLLYDGGQTKGRIKAARLSMFAARENLIETEQSILLAAITTYMEVNRTAENLKLAHNNVSVLKEQLDAIENRFALGEVTKTDVSQTQARLANAISNQEEAQTALYTATASYISIIGKKPGKRLHIGPPPTLPSSLEKIETKAIKTHPRMRAAHLSLKAAKENAIVAQKSRRPTIIGTLSASSNSTDSFGSFGDNDNISTSISINANFPIYQGGLLASKRRAAQNAITAKHRALDAATAQTRFNTRQSYAQWKAALATVKAVKIQIESSEFVLEGITEEAKLGARTTLDVLNAEQELLSARSRLISAQRDVQVQTYTLLSEMGLLTAEHLGLNVTLYKPADNFKNISKPSKLGTFRNNLFNKIKKRY